MRLLLAAALILSIASSCKRPGTDRDLQCDRYAEMSIERQVECGGSVGGTKLTDSNAAELTKVAKDACMSDNALSPTADCIKQLEAASCDGPVPSPAQMPACRKSQ